MHSKSLKYTNHLALIFFMNVVAPPLAPAAELQCSAKQDYCLVKNKRLVTGDKVVFISEDQEVVAFGEVTDMRGQSRKVELTKKNAQIMNSAVVKRMDENNKIVSDGGDDISINKLEVYKEPAKISIGGSVAMSQMNIAADALAYSGEGFGFYRLRPNIYGLARLRGFSVSGSTETGEVATDVVSYSAKGLILSGGLAYGLFPKSPISARVSGELGLGFVSAYSDGYSNAEGIDKLGSGVAMAFRAGGDLLVNRMGLWHPMATVAFEQVRMARATTLGLGVQKDLP